MHSMANISFFRYTRSERRSVGLLVVLILLINMGTIAMRSFAEPAGFLISEKNQPDVDPAAVFAVKQKSLIELNSADSTDLLALYGIGAVFSKRIIKYRNLGWTRKRIQESFQK